MAKNSNSCNVKIEKRKLLALVDSRAEVSLINMKIYQSLRFKPHLKKISVNLQSVNGEQLKVHGHLKLELILNGVKLEHSFYVVSNMNRNLILGQDWLIKNVVRICYDLGCLG